MKARKKWTPDEREFSTILDMMESRNQMSRIVGRQKWCEFEKRFTKEQLDEMAESIGARKTR